MQNETLTNVFWGLFFIWLGLVAAINNGDFYTLVNGTNRYTAIFGLGTGFLLLVMNTLRGSWRLKVGSLTLGLGVILVLFYAPQVFLDTQTPFFPTLIAIFGVALVIGAIRTAKYL